MPRIGADLVEGGPLLQVGAGREGLAVAGQHHGPDIGAVAQRVEDGDDLFTKAAVLRVHRRARERHCCDVVGNLNLEALVGLGHVGVLVFYTAGTFASRQAGNVVSPPPGGSASGALAPSGNGISCALRVIDTIV